MRKFALAGLAATLYLGALTSCGEPEPETPAVRNDACGMSQKLIKDRVAKTQFDGDVIGCPGALFEFTRPRVFTVDTRIHATNRMPGTRVRAEIYGPYNGGSGGEGGVENQWRLCKISFDEVDASEGLAPCPSENEVRLLFSKP